MHLRLTSGSLQGSVFPFPLQRKTTTFVATKLAKLSRQQRQMSTLSHSWGNSKSKQHGYVTRPYQSSQLRWTGRLIQGNKSNEQVIHLHWSTRDQYTGQNDPSRMFVHRGCIDDTEGHFMSHNPKGEEKADSSAHPCHSLIQQQRSESLQPWNNTTQSRQQQHYMFTLKVLRLVLCSVNPKHKSENPERLNCATRRN